MIEWCQALLEAVKVQVNFVRPVSRNRDIARRKNGRDLDASSVILMPTPAGGWRHRDPHDPVRTPGDGPTVRLIVLVVTHDAMHLALNTCRDLRQANEDSLKTGEVWPGVYAVGVLVKLLPGQVRGRVAEFQYPIGNVEAAQRTKRLA